MRLPLGLISAAILIALPGHAHAQSITQAQTELSAVLADAERNLLEAEAIGMNVKDWRSRFDSYKPRFEEYNRRMDESNAYCQGTFEHDEYVRRTAQCESTHSQLATLLAQLEPERANLETESLRLQQRDADRQKAMVQVQSRLSDGLKHLTFGCALLSAEEFAAQCHLPPAPGPRTAKMVADLNASFSGTK